MSAFVVAVSSIDSAGPASPLTAPQIM